MTATVTKLSTRHSWDKAPRADDPKRHFCTCRREGCGLKRRSEPVAGEWLEFWRYPDGEEGSGRKAPACRAAQAPAEPPKPAMSHDSVPPNPATTRPCCHHVLPLEPCGLPTHPYPDGPMCGPAAAAVSKSRAEGLRKLRSATSGMGVATWRGEVA